MNDPSCPCGGGTLASCCGRYLDGADHPATAVELMRSRYSAYVLRRELYLRESWHPRTRPAALELDAKISWLGLSVLSDAQQDDTHATVEFVARFRARGCARRLHEHSRFEKRRGIWLYVDGDVGT